MDTDLPAGGVPLDALLAHRAWVRALARRLVTDENAADDVEQETWRMALERPPLHATSLRAWLSAVVRNAARVAGRSRTRRRAHETAAPVRPAEPGPGDVVAEAEVQHRLVAAVLALDEPYRSAVLARWFEGREATEIAARSGIPVETVRTRLKRAVAMLRERMDGALGDDDRAWCLLVLGWTPAGIGGGAAAAGSGTSSGTTAALSGAAGGVAMGIGTKLALGAAAVVVALLAWRPWDGAATPGVSGPVVRTTAAVDTSHAPARGGKRARPGEGDAAAGASSPANGAAGAASADARLAACDRDLDLHGVVVRKDGTPVPGAALQAVTYPWRRANSLNWEGAFDASVVASGTSAADGTFSLRLARGEGVSLRASKDGLASLELVERQAGERVRVVMEPGVRLVVAATDAAGKPAPDVRLRVWRLMPKDGGTTVDLRGVTGADGVAAFPGLPGALDVMVMPESRLGNVGMKRLKLPETGETKLDLVLPAGRTVRGRVTDAATGAPVGGARVGMGWPLIQSVTSQPDGSYALEGWTGDGFSDLNVLATGYARAAAAVADRETIDIPLLPGAAARGRVVGADGKPVGGALVSCMAMWRGDRVQSMSACDTRTDDDGVFHLTGLDGRRAHALTVAAPGAGRVRREVAFAPNASGEADLGDIALAAARAIEGRVLDPAGNPAARVVVTLTSHDMPRGLAENLGPGTDEKRFTDDLGRFRFPGLAPGAYTVQTGGGGASATTSAMSARVVLPADRDVLDVVLAPLGSKDAPPPGTIAVTVTDESGAPLRGVSVVGQGNLAKVLVAPTDANGRAVLAVPPDGRLRGFAVGYQVPRDFLRVPEVRVVQGRTEYAVTMVRGVHVTCVVLDPESRPVPRASVQVEPSGLAVTWTNTDDEGRVRFVLPREGNFSFRFEGFVHRAGPQKPGEPFGDDTGLAGEVDGVTAASGEVVMRCRRVASGRSVTLRLLEEDGTPAAGLQVTLAAGGLQTGSSKTDAEGRATFEGLTARPTTAWAAPRPGMLNLKPEPFVPDGREVVVRFPASVRISGVATWSSGEPAARAHVNVYEQWQGADALTCWTQCDENGRFTVKVPAGTEGPYEIEAATMRADRTPTGVRRPLATGDRDVQLVVPR